MYHTYDCLCKEFLEKLASKGDKKALLELEKRKNTPAKMVKKSKKKNEPRGLKKDIIFEVYHRMPRGYYESERVKEDMIKYLQEFPLTNDFKEKFHDYMDDKMGK